MHALAFMWIRRATAGAGCRFSSLLCIGLLAVLALAGGCATSFPTRVERPPADVPDHFVTENSQGVQVTPTPGLSPGVLVDPRNGNWLHLVRSRSGIGDYETPAGSYGVHQDELLRVGSSDGKALGIVPR